MRETVDKRKRLNELRRQLDDAWLNGRFDSDRIAAINAELRELIKGEPPPPVYEPWAWGPQCTEDGMKFSRLDADSVMTAAEVAAGLFKCRASDILSGRTLKTKEEIVAVSRARGYAAMALQSLFSVSGAQISRALGSSEATHAVHLSTFTKKAREGDWFDQKVIDTIAAEVTKGLLHGQKENIND